jgi:transposase
MRGGALSLASTRIPMSITRRCWTSGRLLGTAALATTREGYEQLIAWVAGLGVIDRVGVKSTGSFAAGLVRALQERAIVTVEANQPHAHTRHRRGKSDPIDAELAARAVLGSTSAHVRGMHIVHRCT